MGKREDAVEVMRHLVTHDSHGYTQGNRWGNGRKETIMVNGNAYQVALGDRDCSSGCISAWEAVGVDCGGATYTGNMRSCMTRTGNFVWKPMSFIAEPGDMYLNEGNHVAMCLQQVPDQLMEFSISENGTIYGKEGDQTGRESRIGTYYSYPWDGILHYTGGGASNPSTPAPPTTPSIPKPYLVYRVSVDPEGKRWFEEMHDTQCSDGCGDDYAGDGSNPICWIAIDMPGWYQVQTEAHGWLEPVRGYNVDDLEYGCAGDGSPILAVRCYYETQDPASTGWLAIAYQVDCDGAWLDVMHDTYDTGGSGDDFAGDGKQIKKFRAWLVDAD